MTDCNLAHDVVIHPGMFSGVTMERLRTALDLKILSLRLVGAGSLSILALRGFFIVDICYILMLGFLDLCF